jgi:hypothetical protein
MTGGTANRAMVLAALVCGLCPAQILISGRVVDETGAPVTGARIELRPAGTPAVPITASSDAAGNFPLNLPAAGDYDIRAERQGFYLFQLHGQPFSSETGQLIVTLNHQQEFSESVDVIASAAVIDPDQPADRKEIDNTEMLAIPYPAPQDYRNSLQLMNGVVQDNAARFHFNGGTSRQTDYTLDGFNLSNPATGQLDARMNIDSVQSITASGSRFSAQSGRGSAGVVDVQSKMGDDHLRFAGTNFVPGISSDGGWHFNKWTPRLEVSGPIVKGRAWFHNGLDAFYSNDVIHGLPAGQNRTSALSATDLSRFQVNLTPGNILTGGFLVNQAETKREGLSFLQPVDTTTNGRQALLLSSIRDQISIAGGGLLELGFADTRGMLRTLPQGDQLYQITPLGNRGNYFVDLDRHYYRQQEIANLFLPALHFWGTHQLKFGLDFEREAFHQRILRHDYEVLRDDGSVSRYVTFAGAPFASGKNFESAEYVEDHWNPREGLSVEAGLRLEWNEIVRDLELGPRIAAAWSPARLHGTKLSAGWGVYHDAIPLDLLAQDKGQVSLAMFYPPGVPPIGPVATNFVIGGQALRTPYFQIASVGVERKLPLEFYVRTEYIRRAGNHGFTFAPATAETPETFYQGATFELRNIQRARYDAIDFSVKRTFAGQYEWFAGYTRSSARTNTAVDYSLENPIFAAQMTGPLPWNAANRFHIWGWAPLPNRRLPQALRFITRNTTANYLLEYRSGFPFSVVDENGLLRDRVNGSRLPDYFSLNLHFERRFRAINYLWAWRCGLDNLTNNGNPNNVNNVYGTPQFLTYGRGQARAFSVRLRFLGRR